MGALVLLSALFYGAFACQGPGVNISGTAGVRRSYDDEHYGLILDARFGDDVNIICSGTDSKNLTIRLEESRKGVSSGKRNLVAGNTTELTVQMPGIGGHVYSCTDETACTAQLRVEVWTVVTVLSPNVRRKVAPYGEVFFVPLAEDYEVACSGTPELRISKERYDIETISVNKTAIKSRRQRETEYTETYYECKHSLDHFRSVGFTNKVDLLIFDYPPAATDFWCVEYKHVYCSWTALSRNTTFTLFWHGNLTLYEGQSSECNLNHEYNNDVLNFVMRACNFVYCTNETYHINRSSIRKISPPFGLEAIKQEHGEQGVVLTWRHNTSVSKEYKVIYRIPCIKGMKNSSLLIGDCDNCKLELTLPFPGACYEVKVYAKLTSTPLQDAYWSDPSRITFRTDPHNTNIDPLSNVETEEILNKEIAVYKVREFARGFQKAGSALRGKVNALRRKLDLVKKMCREKSLDECKYFKI